MCSANSSSLTSFYLKEGRVDPTALSSLLDQGGDLIFSRLDQYLPRLWRLCHQIAEQIGEQVTAEAIVTSGKQSRIPQRYDNERHLRPSDGGKQAMAVVRSSRCQSG